jgi:hypothetical protein
MRTYKVSPEVMIMLLGAVVRQAASNFVGTGQIGEPFLSVLDWSWREYPDNVGDLGVGFASAAGEMFVASQMPWWPTDADQVVGQIGEEFRARGVPFDPDLSLRLHAALTAG